MTRKIPGGFFPPRGGTRKGSAQKGFSARVPAGQVAAGDISVRIFLDKSVLKGNTF
jgi:hypothetical protein